MAKMQYWTTKELIYLCSRYEIEDKKELADKMNRKYISLLQKVHALRKDEEMENKKDIYKKALNKWGAEAQTIMVFEEMAELQKELCKAIRNNYSLDDLAEEIADVEIMLEQMKILFMIEDSVQEQKKYKLQRLREALK